LTGILDATVFVCPNVILQFQFDLHSEYIYIYIYIYLKPTCGVEGRRRCL